jgi:NSS family neurotransmitter:Na+ symporter
MEENRERWPSRLSFVMAAIGSAVGLGNVWRFPYVAYANGGGAFLIPYFTALITAGIPLMILEYALGQRFQAAAPEALARINKGFRWLGWFALLVGLSISFYYAVVMSYAWHYTFASATLAWTKPIDPAKQIVVPDEDAKKKALEEEDAKPEGERREVYTQDENAGKYFEEKALGGFAEGKWRAQRKANLDLPEEARVAYWREMFLPVKHLVFFTILTWAIIFIIIYKGTASVGKVVLYTVPAPVILLGVLIVYGLTLKGAGRGIEFFLNPRWELLADVNIWLRAYGQIFFSLSLGFGILIAYASYEPRESDISNNAFITSFANCATSFYASFAVFSVVGYLATAMKVPEADVIRAGPGLVFVTYPIALAKMGAAGKVLGVAFFLSLLTLGIDSAFSIVEAVVAGIKDRFHKVDRRVICGVVCGAGCLFGLIYCTRSGLMWLDIVDNWMNNYGLAIVGLLECVAVAYFYNIEEIREFVNQRSEIRLAYWWDAFIKFITPAVLVYLLSVQISKDLSATYGAYDEVLKHSVTIMGWGYMVLMLIVSFAVGRNWTPFAWALSLVGVTLVLRLVTSSFTIAGMAAMGLVLLFGGLATCLVIAVRGRPAED